MRTPLHIRVLILTLVGISSVSVLASNKPNSGSELLNQVNSCDSACTDQIIQTVNQRSNSSARLSAATVVEKSKQDQHWQNLLLEAISIQTQTCDAQAKKTEGKKPAKDNRLSEFAERANVHIKITSDPYLAAFMRLQLNRVWNAPCPSYVAHLPSRRDPEDTEAQKEESATNDPPDDDR